jgi:hypothetical protein
VVGHDVWIGVSADVVCVDGEEDVVVGWLGLGCAGGKRWGYSGEVETVIVLM